jgi:RimJ/RimL family protein N-acetyltransferase
LPGRAVGAGHVTLVDLASLRRHALPAELLADLESGANHSPIAATWVDGAPVSFCYAGTVTESIWDVALETLEPHRRRGYATSCATFMIHLMRDGGREPAWGALETNRASRRLADKLGFDRV